MQVLNQVLLVDYLKGECDYLSTHPRLGFYPTGFFETTKKLTIMTIQLQNCIKYFNTLILRELQEVSICWMAGGCIRDYFSTGKLDSDIDIFFPDADQFEKCRKYLIDSKERSIKTIVDEKEVVRIIPKENAVVLFQNDNVVKIKYKGRKYDLVKKYFASPELTIEAFDFTVCCAAVDGKSVFTHDTFWIDLAKRQLMINKLPFPLSTLWRLQKYIKKGYTICSGEMLTLAKAIEKLQLNTTEGESAAVNDDSQLYDDGPTFTTFD